MIILSFDVGIKNLAYCQIDSITKDILDWNIIDCSINKKDNQCQIIKLISELDSIPNLLESEIILIEKQPSFNPIMRIISNAIYVYFILRISYELNTDNYKKIKILYYSAKNKLKLCTETDSYKKNEQYKNSNNRVVKKDRAKNYYNNKKAAIEHTNILLTNDDFLTFFNKSKKKDDLADCYLQALAYLN